jgi:hypothetical protein
MGAVVAIRFVFSEGFAFVLLEPLVVKSFLFFKLKAKS